MQRGIFLLVVLIAVFNTTSIAQKEKDFDMLLTNQRIQLECTEAVDSMYNFKFDVAEKQFKWLKQQYPTHPLPYFLMGLSAWWKMMPNDEDTQYDDVFFAYMDSTITFAEKLYKTNSDNPEASFFLAGAYGFKGRLESDRDNYVKATFSAKKSLNYLNHDIDKGEDFNPEFLYGTALYNYFREWIPENKKFLKPVVMFFPKGNKEKGISQLEHVSNNAFYTRIEAMTFLMRIQAEYENEREKAFPLSKYLSEAYPDNAFFHAYHAKQCYMTGRYLVLNDLCENFIQKYDSKYPGYEEEGLRKISFYYASICKGSGRDEEAKEYFQKSVECAIKVNAMDMGYTMHALDHLAQYAIKDNNKDLAVKYYQIILEAGDNDNKVYKKAKEYVKEYNKSNRKNR